MDATTVWQFLAIFFAASLAFILEDVRERRRTRRWVKQHLRHLAEMISEESGQSEFILTSADGQLDAIDAWLTATSESDLTDEQWDTINNRWNSSNVDLGPILRSEALSVLPEELARSLAQFENTMRYVEVATAGLNRTQTQVQDAWAHREVPLSAVNKRRVASLREDVEELRHHMPAMYEKLGDTVRQLDQPRNRTRFRRV